MKHFYILLLSIIFVACNKDGGNKFGALDGKIDDGSTQNLDPISISSWTPETTAIAPLVMTNKSTAVFGVLVSGNVGSVNYDFIKMKLIISSLIQRQLLKISQEQVLPLETIN